MLPSGVSTTAYRASAVWTSVARGGGVAREIVVVADALRHGRELQEADDGEEVGRDEEGEDAGVVRRPEAGRDEADRVDRIAVAAVRKHFG